LYQNHSFKAVIRSHYPNVDSFQNFVKIREQNLEAESSSKNL